MALYSEMGVHPYYFGVKVGGMGSQVVGENIAVFIY